MIRRLISSTLMLSGLAGLAGMATAAPVLSTLAGPTAGASFGGCPLVTGIGTAVYGPCADQFSRGTAQAIASIGHVGATAHHTAFGGSIPAGHAAATYEDQVVFSGPSGGSIPVALNRVLSGQLVSNPDVAQLGIAVSINHVFVGTFTQMLVNGGTVVCDNNGFIGLSACKDSYSDRIVTSTINVPVGVFVDIGLSIEASVGGAAPGSSAVEFLNSLDFVGGSDLFNLPDGYTANSETSFIVDNRFVPDTGGGPANVPVPATTPLLMAGLAALAWTRRRRLPGR
jgi:hypothetical protein